MTKARTLADNFAADINGITAGTGITGGGTSGTVTITNDMATTIAAKGDLIIGTGNDTYNRLAVASTAGYLLSVDSAETTGLKWAAPAASGGDDSSNDDTGDLQIRFNNDTTSNYHLSVYQQVETNTSYQDGQSTNTYYFTASGSPKAADNNNSLVLTVYDYATSGIRRNAEFWNSTVAGGGSNSYMFKAECGYQGTSAITRIDLLLDAGSFDGGTYVLYGVK
jgi:hypothetical protein